jgi:hypothetical protein
MLKEVESSHPPCSNLLDHQKVERDSDNDDNHSLTQRKGNIDTGNGSFREVLFDRCWYRLCVMSKPFFLFITFILIFSWFCVTAQDEEVARISSETTVVYETPWIKGDDLNAKICVSETSRDVFTCSTRGKQFQKAMNGNKEEQVNLGVIQRVDGSQDEKEATREVIFLMKQYFLNEVMVKPVYRNIRHKW